MSALARQAVVIEPNVPGLVRWLQHVYQTDRACAVRILRTAWPALADDLARDVLAGRRTLHVALTIAADRDGVA